MGFIQNKAMFEIFEKSTILHSISLLCAYLLTAVSGNAEATEGLIMTEKQGIYNNIYSILNIPVLSNI
jgi:hypothetical protein